MHPFLPQLFDHRPAVLFREHDIDEQKIEARTEREVQAGLAIARGLDVVTAFLEPFDDKGGGLFLVLDEQDRAL
jgi:hypothetical protein